MANDKLRRQIIHEAARLMYAHQESEYYRAKLKAARRIGQSWIKPADMPTNQEIRDEIQSLARLYEGRRREAGPLPLESSADVDRFAIYHKLLAPLATVKQNPVTHPEGDALYHSLQVFELARNALPYDEEFQLAALLHDVGKAIDPREHIAAGLEALDRHVSDRTAWLIEHHPQAAALREGTLGVRARRRLEASEDFDDVMLLYDCDRQGRQKGVLVCDVEDALAHLRELSSSDDTL